MIDNRTEAGKQSEIGGPAMTVADDDMFDSEQAETATAMQQIDVLAQHIAHEMDGCDKAKKALSERNGKLDSSKEQLCKIMKEAGMDSVKLACGLSPSASYKPQYYAVDGCSGPDTMAWLREHDLGDIIKLTVNFQTLQSTLKDYEAQGKDVPETFATKSMKPTIRMNGKSKYLAAQADGSGA